MPRKTSSKKRQKRPRHVIFWIRETLDLTQKEFGEAIGASWHTVQAIENQHLPLSARFAYAIADKTGVSVNWLMRNKLKPLPDPAKIRACFKRRQDLGTESPYYIGRLSPKDFLFKLYILEREIADELGAGGCRNTGFYDILRATIPKLFECIPNPKIRQRVRRAASDLIAGGLKEVLSSVIADIQELIRVIKKREDDETADWKELEEGLRAAAEWKPSEDVSPSVREATQKDAQS